MAAGMALVPEDRRQQGLVMDLGIDQNVALALARPAQPARADPRASSERALASTGPSGCSSSSAGCATPSSTLSGGNQQKVVLGKWLAREPKLLIIDEPTRGIDVGTKAEVHRILDGLVADGMAVLMISSELPEVLGMADRVLVLREGRLTAELPAPRPTRTSIMRAATGQSAESWHERARPEHRATVAAAPAERRRRRVGCDAAAGPRDRHRAR